MSDKIVASSIVGLMIFAVLVVLLYFAVTTFVPRLVPPDYDAAGVSPYFGQALTAALWWIIGFSFAVFTSNFIGGWWGTNADEPSGHGAISGLIVSILGILILGLVGTAVSDEAGSIMQILSVIPFFAAVGGVGGFLGSMSGHQFHILWRKIRQPSKGS